MARRIEFQTLDGTVTRDSNAHANNRVTKTTAAKTPTGHSLLCALVRSLYGACKKVLLCRDPSPEFRMSNGYASPLAYNNDNRMHAY